MFDLKELKFKALVDKFEVIKKDGKLSYCEVTKELGKKKEARETE